MNEARRDALRHMLAADPEDAFALYGLALEHKVVGELELAEPLLRRLLEVDPDQLYGYYQLGEVLLADARPGEAEPVLTEGVRRARAAGDLKAKDELQALLDQV